MSNGVYLFYIIALIPAIIGAILFMCNKKVNGQEWLGGTVIAFLVSGIMHGIAIYSMTDDIECWSGKITHACHFPQWVEQYQKRHSRTTYSGSGKNRVAHTRVWYTTEYATHSENWVAYLNFGEISQEKSISLQTFNEIKANFGEIIEDGGKQSNSHGGHRHSGDNNIYKTPNKTGYVYPVTTIQHFENKIKAAPTLFSFVSVPSNCPVYHWPENPNWMASDRLLGVVGISPREFDLMNSRLGPTKLVNVIMVGFNSADTMLGRWQEAKWVGGKKNDLVITYGFQGTNVVWAYCFGWTEKELCKRNLEAIIMSNPINDKILPLIEQEIKANYTIKDWTKFDYISIEPPRWAYITLIILMIVSQVGFWFWANCNEFTKESFNAFRYQFNNRRF
jgi:hypothetical protein